MAQEQFYTSAGWQAGTPVSADGLKQLAKAGALQPTDLVRRDAPPEWIPAGSVTGLFEPPAAPAGRLRRTLGLLLLHLSRAFAWNVSAVGVSRGEQARLEKRAIGEDTARRYLVWRRSLLLAVILPLGASAVLGLTSEDFEILNNWGKWVTSVDILALFALPGAALLAALFWSRPRLSRYVLLAGWVIGFLAPVLTALFPLDWLIEIHDAAWMHQVPRALQPGAENVARIVIRLAAGVLYYLSLMPVILSLIPGMLRACVRVKSLLPGSVLPGWFLVAGAPLYVLLLLVAFIAVNQMIGNLLLFFGVTLLLLAPLVYLVRAPVFVRPLEGDAGRRAMSRSQWAYVACTTLAFALLLTYLLTKKIGPFHVFDETIGPFYLVGPDEDTSLLRPWRVVQFAVEYLGRSLFITVVAADLLLAANLSIWRGQQRFAGTPLATDHDRRMRELETILGGTIQ